MCVRALRITVLKSAGNFTRDECHDLNAEKIQRVKCFLFTRSGICCVLAIFERRRGRLGSKISGYGQLAEVAVYFAMAGLLPEADTNRKGRHVRWGSIASVDAPPVTSGLPRSTDIVRPARLVRFVPTTDVRYIVLVRISEPRRARRS
jgi:hypothetical protein